MCEYLAWRGLTAGLVVRAGALGVQTSEGHRDSNTGSRAAKRRWGREIKQNSEYQEIDLDRISKEIFTSHCTSTQSKPIRCARQRANRKPHS